ncbi:MAG: hypothetical protein VX278_06615 [Myxococcota bacterium]|nr:hypothetical protein [Myxococcota bacterium]
MLPWLTAFIFGCSKQNDTAEANSCTEGETAVVLITELVYTLPDEEGHIKGFNLDQYITESGDDEGCGHEDMTSPSGEEGIDSAFSKLAPVLDMIGASQVQDYIRAAIETGDLLVVLELSGLDSPLNPDLNDECASLTIKRAKGTPYLGTDGTILSNQTFELNAEEPATNTVTVQFSNGEMTASGIDMTLPVQLLDEHVTLILNQTSLHLQSHSDGTFTGYFAGGLPVSALKDRLSEIGDIGDLSEVVPDMVETAADLFPTDSGTCSEISIGLDFTGKPAFLFPY